MNRNIMVKMYEIAQQPIRASEQPYKNHSAVTLTQSSSKSPVRPLMGIQSAS